jgi:hypothetical protein
MNNSPEITRNGIVSVLSISPMEEDHFFLQDILHRLQGTLDPVVRLQRTSAPRLLPRLLLCSSVNSKWSSVSGICRRVRGRTCSNR